MGSKLVAEQFGTLESLSPGHIDLGLGRVPGSDQATSQILDPRARLRSYEITAEAQRALGAA